MIATHVGVVNRGAETFAIELSKHLGERFDVTLFARGQHADLKGIIHTIECNEGAVVPLLKWILNRSRLYRGISDRLPWIAPEAIFQRRFTKKVSRTIDGNNPNGKICIFPNNGVYGARWAKKYAKTRRAKWIYTGHGGIGRSEAAILQMKPDAYIAITKENAEWAKGISSNVECIPNGIDLNRFHNVANKKENVRCRQVLSVAALERFKRHELTIQAVSTIPNVALKILGTGTQKSALTNLCDELLPGRYEISSVKYENIHEAYQEADVFVLPSDREPFGIVYLEAMASGLPIVAQLDDSRKEIIGNAGILVDCTDIHAFTDAINKALSYSWKTVPRAQAEKFSWKAVSEQYANLINRITSDV
jgi:glycosyltransferase involved in cell wall biosynthesis